MTANNYKKMGEKFITHYYERMKPFDQLIILGLETTDRMTLPDGSQWHVRIDKLGCDSEGNYNRAYHKLTDIDSFVNISSNRLFTPPHSTSRML